MRGLLIGSGILLGIYIMYRCYYQLNLDGSLETRLKRGAMILDVRTRPEWARGHIEGAVNIPLSELRKGPIPLDSSRPIITCCSHGLRSVKALSVLKARGYHNVCNGGAWTDLEEIVRRVRH